MPTRLLVPLLSVTTPSILNACFSPVVATPIAFKLKNHVFPVPGSGYAPLNCSAVAVASVVCAVLLFNTSGSLLKFIVSLF